MKWIFLLGLLAFTPALTAFLRGNRAYIPAAAFVLGLLPFIESRFNVSAAPITWPTWPGMAKGIELSLTDAVAIALIVAGHRIRTPWALRIALGAYVLAFLVSTAVSVTKIASLFYGWQIVRAVLVYLAVARASAVSPRVPIYLLSGLIAGLAVQAVVVAIEYAGGDSQAGGWFGHQNLLGMATHFIVYPAFALFLAGYYPRRTGLAVLAALIVAFAGGSRATVGLLAVGLIGTGLISCWLKMTGRKATVAAASMICVLAAIPLLYSAIERRSAEQRMKSSQERGRMQAAARMILSDYPLGVGANRYVVVANVGGYSARANVVWSGTNRSAPVHNSYYLVAAEMGWLGLFSFIGFFATVIATAVATLRRASDSFDGEYLAGITVTLVAVAIHSYVEWITMLHPIHVLFAMTAGLLVTFRARQARPQRGRVVSRSPELRAETSPGTPSPA